MPFFPPELVDMIIAHLRVPIDKDDVIQESDFSLLRSTSLVCRSWCIPSRTCMMHSMMVSLNGASHTRWMLQRIHQCPQLASYVRYIHIDMRWYEGLSKARQSLFQLPFSPIKLSLRHFVSLKWGQLPSFIESSLSFSVRHLSLQLAHFPLESDFVAFILRCPGLSTLRLSEVRIDKLNLSTHQPDKIHLQVLEMCPAPTDTLIDCVLNFLSLDDLTILKIDCTGPILSPGSIAKAIKRAKTVQSVELRVPWIMELWNRQMSASFPPLKNFSTEACQINALQA